MNGAPPVLLIPGLMAADFSMRLLAQTLHKHGYPTVPARIGFNVGCTTELVERLEERLEAANERYGRPAAIVGWSRGGTLGKLVTIRAPHRVSALITLGSPNVDPLAVSRSVLMQIRLLSRLNGYGLRRMLGADCLTGECAASMRALLDLPFPSQVPYVSIYSKRDGVVDWRSCCDPAAELVEVNVSHFQLGIDRRVLRTVLQHLASIHRPPVSAAS